MIAVAIVASGVVIGAALGLGAVYWGLSLAEDPIAPL